MEENTMNQEIQKQEYELLKTQLRRILQNQTLTEQDVVASSAEVEELQSGLVYLSACLGELQHFVAGICTGDLDAPQPGRHNYLAGGLKELHAVLRHLTWQTQQVAEGDYQQRIDFLGDFSDAFNTMVKQLDERERRLKENGEALARNNDLLRTIMDTHKDWIIVEREEDGEIVYNNRQELFGFENFEKQRNSFLERFVLEGNEDIGTAKTTTYISPESNRYYSITSYYILWEDKDAKVHYISDITQQRLAQKSLSEIAYLDTLTGAYNRRYCILQIEKYLEQKMPFSLVMVDINSLKAVNDTFGHSAGDEYINTIVHHIRAMVRDSDVLCRIGGDEFILLLKQCPEACAQQKMQEIFDRILQDDTKGYQMSLSYGLVCIDENNTRSVRELMELSDEKMYQFKQAYKQRERETL